MLLLPQPVPRQHLLTFLHGKRKKSLSDAGALAVGSHVPLFPLPYRLPEGCFTLLLQSWQNVGQGLTLLHWHWKRLFFWRRLREIALECYRSIRMTEEWRSRLNCRHSSETSSSQIYLHWACSNPWPWLQASSCICIFHRLLSVLRNVRIPWGQRDSYFRNHWARPICSLCMQQAEQILMQFEKDVVISSVSQVFKLWRILDLPQCHPH